MRANKPYIIGLTGGIGTGKSEAAKFLETLGAVQVDADEISHGLTAPGAEALPEIREAFGNGVFEPDGSLNRRELARVAFEDPGNRRKLEAILHPRVQREMMRRIDLAAEENVKVVFLNVPLLFETGVDALCDETWVLLANPETQVARVMMRDRVEREDVEIRIVNQMANEEKAARATVVVSTDRPIEKTQAELAALYQQVLKKL